MDRIASYKITIQQELERQARRKAVNRPTVEGHLIIDKDCNQFILLSVGKHGIDYIHEVRIHLQIKNGKILIHEDSTDPGILEILMEKGIPEEDILPVYLPDYEWEEESVLA